MEPQLFNKLTTTAFRAFKFFGTSSEGDCNSEHIRAQQVSDTSNWEGFRLARSVALLYSE